MKPVSPVLRKACHQEVTYGADQPEYLPLPAVRDEDGRVTTRWRMTWRERLRVLLTGELYLQILTFNSPLQPVKVTTCEPEV